MNTGVNPILSVPSLEISHSQLRNILKCDSPTVSTTEILSCLYTLFNLSEKHEIINFQQKISAGMIQVPGWFNSFDFKNLQSAQISQILQKLNQVKKEEIQDEVVEKMLQWIQGVVDTFEAIQIEQQEEQVKKQEDQAEQQVDPKITQDLPHQETFGSPQIGSESPVVQTEILKKQESLVVDAPYGNPHESTSHPLAIQSWADLCKSLF